MQQSTQRSQTMYLVFRNWYLIHISFKSNVLSNLGKILKRSIWEKYVKNRLSWYKSSRLPVMQQSPKQFWTMYAVFENSYLIPISLKWTVLNNPGELHKIATWKKYNFSHWNLCWANKPDPAAAAQRHTLFFLSIFENS